MPRCKIVGDPTTSGGIVQILEFAARLESPRARVAHIQTGFLLKFNRSFPTCSRAGSSQTASVLKLFLTAMGAGMAVASKNGAVDSSGLGFSMMVGSY